MEGRVKAKDIPAIKQKLLALQNWTCPLCNMDLKKVKPVNICVDHDHTTGAIRAAICRGCNGAEGKIKGLIIRFGKTPNPIVFLTRLFDYWKRHATPKTPWIHPTHKTEEEKRAQRNKQSRARYAAAKAGDKK